MAVALSAEGVERRLAVFSRLDREALILAAPGIDLPPSAARVIPLDFKAMGVRGPDRALASLAVLVRMNRVISQEMLHAALEIRFRGKTLAAVRDVSKRVSCALPAHR